MFESFWPGLILKCASHPVHRSALNAMIFGKPVSPVSHWMEHILGYLLVYYNLYNRDFFSSTVIHPKLTQPPPVNISNGSSPVSVQGVRLQFFLRNINWEEGEMNSAHVERYWVNLKSTILEYCCLERIFYTVQSLSNCGSTCLEELVVMPYYSHHLSPGKSRNTCHVVTKLDARSIVCFVMCN